MNTMQLALTVLGISAVSPSARFDARDTAITAAVERLSAADLAIAIEIGGAWLVTPTSVGRTVARETIERS